MPGENLTKDFIILLNDKFSSRARLHKIFGLIEKEFETVYLENVSLQEKLDTLTERLDRESIGTVNERNMAIDEIDGFASFRSNSTSASKVHTFNHPILLSRETKILLVSFHTQLPTQYH